MLCAFCPPTILGDFYRIPEKLPKSSADKMYRACETKDQTLKKIRTLHFPDLSQNYYITAPNFRTIHCGRRNVIILHHRNRLGIIFGRCNSYREFEGFPNRNFWRIWASGRIHFWRRNVISTSQKFRTN